MRLTTIQIMIIGYWDLFGNLVPLRYHYGPRVYGGDKANASARQVHMQIGAHWPDADSLVPQRMCMNFRVAPPGKTIVSRLKDELCPTVEDAVDAAKLYGNWLVHNGETQYTHGTVINKAHKDHDSLYVMLSMDNGTDKSQKKLILFKVATEACDEQSSPLLPPELFPFANEYMWCWLDQAQQRGRICAVMPGDLIEVRAKQLQSLLARKHEIIGGHCLSIPLMRVGFYELQSNS